MNGSRISNHFIAGLAFLKISFCWLCHLAWGVSYDRFSPPCIIFVILVSWPLFVVWLVILPDSLPCCWSQVLESSSTVQLLFSFSSSALCGCLTDQCCLCPSQQVAGNVWQLVVFHVVVVQFCGNHVNLVGLACFWSL